MAAYSQTNAIDFLYSATWAARLAGIHDNIFKQHVFYAYMTSTGRIKIKPGGGLHIEERLLYGKNTTFAAIGKGGKVAINPLDARTMSKWEWKAIAGSIVRYRDDAFKNRGPERVADMVAEDIEVAELSMSDEWTREVFLDGTGGGGLEWDGLQNIVADDPTPSGSYSTVGGIPLSGNTWWQNQYQDMSSLPFETDGLDYMENMMNTCEDGAALIDLIITSQTLYETYKKEVVDIQMVVPTEAKRNKIADLGFRSLYFKEVPVTYDKNAPWTDRMYFINSKTLRIIRSDTKWLEMTAWEPVQRQPDDRVAYIVSYGNLVCNNRRRNGVLFNLS